MKVKTLKRGTLVRVGGFDGTIVAFSPGYYVQTHAWIKFKDGRLEHVPLDRLTDVKTIDPVRKE